MPKAKKAFYAVVYNGDAVQGVVVAGDTTQEAENNLRDSPTLVPNPTIVVGRELGPGSLKEYALEEKRWRQIVPF